MPLSLACALILAQPHYTCLSSGCLLLSSFNFKVTSYTNQLNSSERITCPPPHTSELTEFPATTPSESDRAEQTGLCSSHAVSLNPSDRIRLMGCWDCCVTVAKLTRQKAKLTLISSLDFFLFFIKWCLLEARSHLKPLVEGLEVRSVYQK